MERQAGARRTGEQQSIDTRMPGERAALVGPTDQQANDAMRDLRLVEAVHQELARRRCLFRRLEYHGIAGDQRRNDVAVGKVRRKIVGSEHAEDAMRLVADRDPVAEGSFHLSLRRPLGIGLDRDVDLVDDGRDFGPRLPQRFASLARDQLGKFGFLAADDIGEAAQCLNAIGVGVRRPGGQGRASGGDFGARIANLA